MKIEIIVYKNSGKYYTSCIIESEDDIPLYDDAFKLFVRERLPVVYSSVPDGFVVVRDAEECDVFHQRLYRMSELISI